MMLRSLPVIAAILFGAVLALLSSAALAHKFAPALLELHQQSEQDYLLTWRTSVTDQRSAMPSWPSQCHERRDDAAKKAGATPLQYQGTAVIRQWALHCKTGLAGETLSWTPGEAGQTATLVRLVTLDSNAPQETLVMPGETSYTVPASQSGSNVVVQYLILGGKHILIGLDHLFFVAALLLLAGNWRTLLKTVTAFTVGHSITLALVSLKLIPQWSALIEFGIALTILVLALELAHRKKNASASLLSRYQWPVAGVFGLVHGLGFAGVLSELGLPKENLLSALFAFNVGIELGQLLFVAALAGCLLALRKLSSASYRPVTLTMVYAMGSVSVYWCLSRGVLLLG
ncbi:HupE/UreJ family protein [Spongiibacter nanhainus]|uniref:HupE/UreJ family protein n=1 Tax=Spongiibacter nanhainus TaxID=2794344 RepID=A0A7T4R0B1_9GAMM|nr:HupE/UreJ family protein [Spongiibacter nanhainus]QQD17912.1 HupE/UreJ family protein [Spongiibacter nanhainus]